MTADRPAARAAATAEQTTGERPGSAAVPLLPRPDRSTAGLRGAVALLTPHQLPELERQMEESLSLSARTGSLAPLTQFLDAWAVTVEIARIPSAASRLREAEYTARAVRPDDPAWRTAMQEIQDLHDAARESLGLG
ncbi:hypothetical protein ACFYVL_10875 [Streptomyces sp. NPDC004111]|uniref:hypothetical protein n=1 Tax=Streptomyces sp. NPDC004111 TaxID=3364690 RepID=UPI0036B6BEA3